MRKFTYYAVFEPSTGGSYGVYWPDLPGCVSMGDDLRHAEREPSPCPSIPHLGALVKKRFFVL